jgi:hypothetical protein
VFGLTIRDMRRLAISNSGDKFLVMFIMFAEPLLGGS